MTLEEYKSSKPPGCLDCITGMRAGDFIGRKHLERLIAVCAATSIPITQLAHELDSDILFEGREKI